MSGNTPKHWGFWRGAVAKAIAEERRPLTWGELHVATGLHYDKLDTAIAELRGTGELRYDSVEEVYWLAPSLYGEYLQFLEGSLSQTAQTEEPEGIISAAENSFSSVCEVCGKAGSPLCSDHLIAFEDGLVYPCPMCGRYTVSKAKHQKDLCSSCRDQILELKTGDRSRGNYYFGHPRIVQSFRKKYDLQSATEFVSGEGVSQAIKKIIESAEQEILLSTPWITLNDMSNLIEDRAMGGLQVRLIARPAKVGSPHHKLYSRWIDTQNIKIGVIDELHAKMVISDGRTMYIGSANITYHGMSHWLEAGIVTKDPVLVKPAYDFLTKVMKKANLRMLTEQKKESGESEEK